MSLFSASDVAHTAKVIESLKTLPAGDIKAIVAAIDELSAKVSSFSERVAILEKGIPEKQRNAFAAKVAAEAQAQLLAEQKAEAARKAAARASFKPRSRRTKVTIRGAGDWRFLVP